MFVITTVQELDRRGLLETFCKTHGANPETMRAKPHLELKVNEPSVLKALGQRTPGKLLWSNEDEREEHE